MMNPDISLAPKWHLDYLQLLLLALTCSLLATGRPLSAHSCCTPGPVERGSHRITAYPKWIMKSNSQRCTGHPGSHAMCLRALSKRC